MRKSEHTELAASARIAVQAAEIGLLTLSYGQAAKAAHLSKGGLQRVFPSLQSLRLAVLRQTAELMFRALFRNAERTASPERITSSDLRAARGLLLRRWAWWLLGERLAREHTQAIEGMQLQSGFALPAPCAWIASLHMPLDLVLQQEQQRIFARLADAIKSRMRLSEAHYEIWFSAACGLRARTKLYAEANVADAGHSTDLARATRGFLERCLEAVES